MMGHARAFCTVEAGVSTADTFKSNLMAKCMQAWSADENIDIGAFQNIAEPSCPVFFIIAVFVNPDFPRLGSLLLT